MAQRHGAGAHAELPWRACVPDEFVDADVYDLAKKCFPACWGLGSIYTSHEAATGAELLVLEGLTPEAAAGGWQAFVEGVEAAYQEE